MAGGKGATFESSLLSLIFNATPIANLADNAASSPITNIYASLHTSSPGASGNQTTNEAAYTSYARVAVARTSGGWTITGNSVSPNAAITWPTATGGSETETYVGIGKSSTGSGILYYFGPLSSSIVVTNGVVPSVTAGSTITES